jgi:hypothetical protein
VSTVINPHIALLIRGAEDWDSDDERNRLDMSISVEKDTDGEPNEAEVTIHNLNDDARNRIIDPAVRDTPIEIFFAPFGTDERASCFVGEIETKRPEQLRPGMATHLTCKSQQWQSRDKFIDPTTYEKGTPITEVIQALVEVIDLPINLDLNGFSVDSLLLSETISGPAFLALRRFVEPYGLTVFICDGVLHFSDAYEVPNPTIVQITNAMLTGPVEPTERRDVVDVVMRTITDSTALDPFARPRKKKRKKRTLPKQAKGPTDYIEYDAVDDTIFGVVAETLGVPAILPDHIVQFEDDDQYYRVRTVTHAGDTREGVTTTIQADVYEEEVTGGGAF